MTKIKKKERDGMVFLAENGEGTPWMTVVEYRKKVCEKVSVFNNEIKVNPVQGRPLLDSPPPKTKVVSRKKKGPQTDAAVYYRIEKGHLEKKKLYGRVLVREAKK